MILLEEFPSWMREMLSDRMQRYIDSEKEETMNILDNHNIPNFLDKTPKLLIRYGNLRLVGFPALTGNADTPIEYKKVIPNMFEIVSKPFAVGDLDENEMEILVNYEEKQKITLPKGSYKTEIPNNYQGRPSKIKKESQPRSGDSFWSESDRKYT